MLLKESGGIWFTSRGPETWWLTRRRWGLWRRFASWECVSAMKVNDKAAVVTISCSVHFYGLGVGRARRPSSSSTSSSSSSSFLLVIGHGWSMTRWERYSRRGWGARLKVWGLELNCLIFVRMRLLKDRPSSGLRPSRAGISCVSRGYIWFK